MPHKLVDLKCENCNHVWESLTMPDDENNILHGCPECGSTRVIQLLGGFGTKCHDPEIRSEMLRKRSVDHSNQHAKENLEKLQNKGILKLK